MTESSLNNNLAKAETQNGDDVTAWRFRYVINCWNALSVAACYVMNWLKKIDLLITALATVLLAIITGALAGIAYWQYRTMHTTDITLHDTLVSTNRAWLTPVAAQIQEIMALNQPFYFTVKYGNPGKEPASGFAAQEDVGTVNALPTPQASLYSVFHKSDLKDVCKRTKASEDGLIVYPSNSTNNYTYDVTTDDFKITSEILNRRQLIFVHGCFAYLSFGEERESEYCFVFLPKDSEFRAVACPYGNHAN